MLYVCYLNKTKHLGLSGPPVVQGVGLSGPPLVQGRRLSSALFESRPRTRGPQRAHLSSWETGWDLFSIQH